MVRYTLDEFFFVVADERAEDETEDTMEMNDDRFVPHKSFRSSAKLAKENAKVSERLL
jgi:hypothetical protein